MGTGQGAQECTPGGQQAGWISSTRSRSQCHSWNLHLGQDNHNQPQEKGGGTSVWELQYFCFGYLSLIFHAQGIALLLPIQPFLPGVRTGPATDQTPHLPLSLSVPWRSGAGLPAFATRGSQFHANCSKRKHF